MGIPRKEAATIIEQFFSNFPKIKDYIDRTIRQAQEQGYVETVSGRRRYLRDINSANGTVRGGRRTECDQFADPRDLRRI